MTEGLELYICPLTKKFLLRDLSKDGRFATDVTSWNIPQLSTQIKEKSKSKSKRNPVLDT